MQNDHVLKKSNFDLLTPTPGSSGVPRGGGGGGVRVQNSEFQYFGGFEKSVYFWGYEYFVDIFWGHHKIGLV